MGRPKKITTDNIPDKKEAPKKELPKSGEVEIEGTGKYNLKKGDRKKVSVQLAETLISKEAAKLV